MALYDPKPFPDADIVPAPVSDGFAVAEFLDWVRTKPAGEWYFVGNPTNCALGQFGRATGRDLSEVVSPDLRFPGLGLNDALGFGGGGCTFGALASRLEAIV